MEINYNHPEFGAWHLTDTPIKNIPYGALIKWFDQVIQCGFHLGGGEIAWRDGVISAKNLDTDPGLPWKRKTCVLAQDDRPVVFLRKRNGGVEILPERVQIAHDGAFRAGHVEIFIQVHIPELARKGGGVGIVVFPQFRHEPDQAKQLFFVDRHCLYPFVF